MYEIFKQLFLRLHGMWNYRWYAMAFAWVVALAIWIFSYSLPDEYRSTARVYIDTESVLKPLLHGLAVETNVMSEVNMMTRVMLSRPNLQKIARETDLDLQVNSNEEMSQLINRLKDNIRITEEYGNMFNISYTHIDRATAGKVVQHLLNGLVEETLGANRTDTTSAQRFLVEQIGEYEKRLSAAEQRLAEFKKKNVGLMPTEGRDYYARLQSAMSDFEKISSELRVAQNRAAELRHQLEGDIPVFFGFGNEQRGATTEEDKRIAEREEQLDKLLLNYTDAHPDVVNLREIIEQLKLKRARKLTELSSGVSGTQANPVYERMKYTLKEAEVDIAMLRARRNEQQSVVDELQALVDTIPEVEAQLKRLNRDYEVTKVQHSALLSRLESARLSEEADKSKDDVEFRIIDPVNVPVKPTGPNRILFLLMATAGGIAAGLGLALLLEQMNPVYVSRDDIRDSLHLPILGSVSVVRSEAQQARMRSEVYLFLLAAAMYFAAGSGSILFMDNGVQLVRSVIY